MSHQKSIRWRWIKKKKTTTKWKQEFSNQKLMRRVICVWYDHVRERKKKKKREKKQHPKTAILFRYLFLFRSFFATHLHQLIYFRFSFLKQNYIKKVTKKNQTKKNTKHTHTHNIQGKISMINFCALYESNWKPYVTNQMKM